MSAAKQPEASDISVKEFDQALQEYPALLEAISVAKGARDGQDSLKALDDFRYGEAIQLFAKGKAQRPMELPDVERLVQWKLRHGKFRPTLMKLVSSNDPALVKKTIQEAISLYRSKPDTSAALAVLTRLKGIGPATASLLLAVHAPSDVIFFADEAFYWLCCEGETAPIKYNVKEYQALTVSAQRLAKRLGVSAMDVERVAFVIMRREDGDAGTAGATHPKEMPEEVAETQPQPVKRKAGSKEGPPSRGQGTPQTGLKRQRKA